MMFIVNGIVDVGVAEASCRYLGLRCCGLAAMYMKFGRDEDGDEGEEVAGKVMLCMSLPRASRRED